MWGTVLYSSVAHNPIAYLKGFRIRSCFFKHKVLRFRWRWSGSWEAHSGLLYVCVSGVRVGAPGSLGVLSYRQGKIPEAQVCLAVVGIGENESAVGADKPVSPKNNARTYSQHLQGLDITGLAYSKELPQMDDYSGKQLQLSTGVAT